MTGLYHCRHTNYCHAFHLYCVLFSTKPECSAKQLLAGEHSYCWLYPSKQTVNCFMLFVHLYCVLLSHLECSVKQVLTADPSVHSAGAGRSLITTSMNNLKVPLMQRSQPDNKLNCTGKGWWVR